MELFVDSTFRAGKSVKAYACVVDVRRRDMVSYFRARKPELFYDLELQTLTFPKGVRTVACVAAEGREAQQNNYGETAAFLMALRIAKHFPGEVTHIHTDSELVYKYWSVGGPKPATAKTMDKTYKRHVDEMRLLRRELTQAKQCEFHHIDGKKNPADFGYHRGK
jgi:ribonuclease HI